MKLIVPAAPLSTKDSVEGVTIEAIKPIPTTLSLRARNAAERIKPHPHQCPWLKLKSGAEGNG
jgi:hypothetical protein